MPPGPAAPCSLAGLLAVFRPCFTAPTFQTFVGLVVGLIAQTRRRTVCGMLTGAGLDQVWHHSRAHRLFTNARWSGDALGLALAYLIVARLLPTGAALTVAVDDTLFSKYSALMISAGRLLPVGRMASGVMVGQGRQAGAGSAGIQGRPVSASRSAVILSRPCLAAVET